VQAEPELTMDRFWKYLVLLFILAALLWYGPVIWNDLARPELWSDWQHDPRWYGPLLLLVAVATAWVFASAIRWQRRWDRMTREERYEESLRILKIRRR
jgi:hypothetical protein